MCCSKLLGFFDEILQEPRHDVLKFSERYGVFSNKYDM